MPRQAPGCGRLTRSGFGGQQGQGQGALPESFCRFKDLTERSASLATPAGRSLPAEDGKLVGFFGSYRHVA